MKTFRLARRTLLRGAGAALALPLLDAMITDSGLIYGTAGAQTMPMPKRLVTLFAPNGVHMSEWWPSSGVGTTSFPLSKVLAPLSTEFSTGVYARDYVSVLGGLDYANGAGHAATRFATGNASASSCGASIDQALAAKQAAGTTRLRSVVVSAEAQVPDATHEPYRLYSSWRGDNAPVEPLASNFRQAKASDPRGVFDLLFPSGTGTATPTSTGPHHDKSVLDAVMEDANRLRSRLGAEDKVRVDAHFAALRELELELNLSGTAPVTSSTCPSMLQAPGTPTDGGDRARLLLKVCAMALKCDVTRIVSFSFGPGMSGFRYPWVPYGSNHSDHGWSHKITETGGEAYRIASAKARVSMLVGLMKDLYDTAEGDKRLLDNTLLYFGNEASNGHERTNLPVLLGGKAGGAHRPGRYVRYSGGTPQGKLLVTIMNMMGVPTQTFGKYGSGTLSGLT